MGYIYMLIDRRNYKKYIGKHNGKYKSYWSGGIIPNKIANKHGRDIFKRIILEENIPENILNEREIYYICKYNTNNDGYNLTKGGDGGDWTVNKSEEEIREIMKKVSQKQKGKFIDKKTREKMSESGKNKIFTEEHKKNISESLKGKVGRTHSQDTKIKISLKKLGIKNDKHSQFMTNNNPRSQKVSVDGIEYDTIKEASEKLNIARHIVKNRLKSKKYENWFKINK